MADNHRESERACGCDQADGGCASLTVQRLSQQRVLELAEEIWTASTGSVLPARSPSDPRSSRPGASAYAAYRRRRMEELQAWRLGWWWRAAAVAAVAGVGGLLIGAAVGAWLGWPVTLLLALLAGWKLRFRPSPSASVWRRQAALQRRTAGVLQPLQQEGHLVLHDVTLPGWPASIDHLVVSATGVWVVESWRGRLATLRRGTSPGCADGTPAGPLRGLRWEAAALAGALADGTSIQVRPLLCVHGGTWLRGHRSVEGVTLATPRQLADVLRQGAPLPPGDVERITARALEVLCPAA